MIGLRIIQVGVGGQGPKKLSRYYFTSVMASSFFQRSRQHTPIPQGPYVVGCTDIMVGKTKEGTLMRLYYPSKATDLKNQVDKWTPWFLGEEYTKGLANFIAPSIPTLFSMICNWQMRGVLTPAIWEAALSDGKFPVIVFSHGLGGNRSIYSTVCCEIASHGFVVAAIEHRDHSACGSFILNENGEKEYVDFHPLGNRKFDEVIYKWRNEQLKIRVEESKKALDVLLKMNEGKVKNELTSQFDLQQLCGRLDVSNPIMSGHSFGGVTTIYTLAKDKRFKIGVTLDPWLYPMKDEAQTVCPTVDQPLISISTEAFQSEANLKAMSNLNDDSTTFITIKGTIHQNQCDTPFIVGPIGRIFVGTSSPLDPLTAMEINNRLIINFICKNLGVKIELQNQIKSYLQGNATLLSRGLHADKSYTLNSNL